jgi:hypothetical protein
VMVVGERTCRGVRSVEIEKGKKRTYFFFVLFLGAVGVILNGGGSHCPPRCYMGHPFGWGVVVVGHV